MSSVLFAAGRQSWEASARRLEDMAGEWPPCDDCFVKVDIEGAEYRTLPSMAQFLHARRATAYVSFHQRFFLQPYTGRGLAAKALGELRLLRRALALYPLLRRYPFIYGSDRRRISALGSLRRDVWRRTETLLLSYSPAPWAADGGRPMIRRLKSLVPMPVRNRLREFRWPARLVPWLPGSSTRFGPPRRWMRLHEYFAGRPGALRPALAAQPLRRPAPELAGEVPARFLEGFLGGVPPSWVFTVDEARLLGAEGWIVAPGDVFLIDASFGGNDPAKSFGAHHIFRSRRGSAPPLRRLQGRCLSLASDFAVGGFGHFVHDSLTRLLLVERAGLSLAEFDWIYLPRPETPVTRAIVSRLGVPPGRILNFDPAFDLSCEHLTATSFPGVPGSIAKVYVDFLRERFSPVPSRRDRRVYLSRRGFRRNFSNAAEVEAVLRRHGFEEVRPREDPETLQKCAEASFVFSIEGAGFYNAAFCPPGTKALLVFPDRLPHAMPYALSLAESAGFRTFMMGGESVGPPELDGGIADFRLDPALLDETLGRMTSC